ncbi:hypothetical protein LLEC1_06775 [Akanthomyces lecanii]|uniref:LysM domain-containing protein n=1 Tax=Cordyceps confragosa TaxID=2714763 RepID=A0A179IKC0_CORDF|nr:hypothetical protein LLEC1_06775 [Akanthomyces lecanii]
MTRFATTFVAALAGANLAAAKCTYKWRAHDGDTCASLSADWGVAVKDFISWNPSVGANCANGLTSGQEYCVEDDGTGSDPTTAPPTSTTLTTTTTTSSTPTQPTGGVPSPTQDGVAKDCKAWYKVQSGDSCDAIVKKFGAFSTDDFLKWNPAAGNDCTGLWVDYYVCVGVPGTPTSPTGSDPSKPSPTQANVAKDCQKWYKVKSGDTCDKIKNQFNTFSIADFLKWNPSAGTDCSGLWVDYYVCVGVPGTPTSPTGSDPSKPSPTQDGITSKCTKYYKAQKGDTCQKIVDSLRTFSLGDFTSWNPAVGRDCTGIWVDYYYCVAVPGTPTTPAPVVPSPHQDGIAKNCKKYYKVQSGDYCDKIITKYNKAFNLQQLVSWNPAIGKDCSHLFVDFYICVGV